MGRLIFASKYINDQASNYTLMTNNLISSLMVIIVDDIHVGTSDGVFPILLKFPNWCVLCNRGEHRCLKNVSCHIVIDQSFTIIRFHCFVFGMSMSAVK